MNLQNVIRSGLSPDLAHVIQSQSGLQKLLDEARPRPQEVASYLDALDHSCRVAAIRSLGLRQLKRLYDAVEGFRRTTIDDIVPRAIGERQMVRHFGKNSLPAFTMFEKRFMRPAKDAAELWGYNFQLLQLISLVAGPGYFVARDAADRGEVDIDYYSVPPERPDGWPPLQSNEKGLSRLVYAYMVDRLRGITSQVSIGRAWKQGKVQSAWFALCRE